MKHLRCRICGYTQPTDPGFCQGCRHPGDSLEQIIECPSCGRETVVGDEWCGWCQEPLLADEEFDDEEGEDLEFDE